MKCEQMCTDRLRDLCKAKGLLMRELDPSEKEILYRNGLEYFLFETLELNETEIQSILLAKNLLGSYFTASEEVFDKHVKEATPLVLKIFQDITNSIKTNFEFEDSNKQTSKIGKSEELGDTIKTQTKKDDYDPEEDNIFDNDLLALKKIMVDNCPIENHWNELIPIIRDVSKINDVLNSSEYESDDEKFGDLMDATKDSIIEACVERLKEGEELELHPDILNEVRSFIWRKKKNFSLRTINNKIIARFL